MSEAKITYINEKYAREQLEILEEDLATFSECISRYGSIRNLITKINDTRSLLNMEPFGKD